MASLSNINGIFDVHSTGAVQFNGNHGASGQILKSNGNAAPTWIPQSDIVGAYLPLAGGTLTGATATASGINFTVGGDLTVTGNQYFNGSFIEGDGKEMFRYTDSWLRINEDNDFASGIYCGSGILRTDGQFQVGSTGNKFKVTSAGVVTALGNITAPSFNGLAINTTGTNNLANQIVRTDVNGYVNFGWINSISGATTSTITRITASNDAYLRYVTPATFRTQITDPYYAPAGTVSGVTSVATGNGLTGGTITSTGTLTMSGDYTGSLSITGANLAGTSFSDPDIVLSITDEDTTASIRNKITGSSAITKISDATAPAPGCFQVNGSYYPQGFGPYYKISEGDEFTFEFWMRYVSGTATYNLLYAGSNFYNAAGTYLGNSQRYWGESSLNINANTGTGWYHVSGTLGPNRGSATGDIPTTAEKMRLLFLFNYNPNGTIVTNYCGLKVYKSNPTVTKLYRKTLGSEASSSGRNRDLVIDSDGDIFGKDVTATGVVYASGGDSNTWNSHTSNTGTVTSVATSNGITGGTITTTGTVSLTGTYTGRWNGTTGYFIKDTRASDITPADSTDHAMNLGFTNQVPGNGNWQSYIQMKGWSDGYTSWQIIGPSTTTAYQNWYLRSGKGTTWNTAREIWHSGNFTPGNYLPLTGGTISGTLTTNGQITANSSLYLKNQITLPASGLSNISGRPAYAIYQEGGAWTNPFPDLCLAMHTGIKLGANASYNGIRFYDDYTMATQVMAVNDSSSPIGAGHVYVNNVLQAGSSVRAPIFYDTNTTYYGDFASTSYINALTLVGTLSGQNAYFNQDVGIGFNSGNIGGKLNIQINSSSGIGIKNNLNGVSNPTGLLQYTSASMNSGGYYMVFQAAPTSGSDTNMLLCNLNGNLRNRNNSYGQYSDETIKENITDATPKLEDVKKLKVKNFNFIGDDLKQIGLIAQETEKVFPGLVEDDLNPQGDRIKSLKYSVLVPILVKAIQELEVRVKELENK